jgi:hypothetical protein
MRKYWTGNLRTPAVLVPYPGPLLTPGAQDIFLSLRPEANGVLVESLLLRVVKSKRFCERCSLVYLANMPGDFVIANRIIEQHYRLKIRFARCGRNCFTRDMRRKFESIFHVPFAKACIIGAFLAERRLGISYEDLFRLRVSPEDFTVIEGQSIKKYNDCYIVNYDIPAILHKNSRKTDFAVMIFRSLLSRDEFHAMVEEMREVLVAEKIIAADRPLARTFHYSSGPFEQIMDGIGYLFEKNGRHLPLESISFFAYLLENGVSRRSILRAVRNPIMRFRTPSGNVFEGNLFAYTFDESFAGALEKFRQRTRSRSITNSTHSER